MEVPRIGPEESLRLVGAKASCKLFDICSTYFDAVEPYPLDFRFHTALHIVTSGGEPYTIPWFWTPRRHIKPNIAIIADLRQIQSLRFDGDTASTVVIYSCPYSLTITLLPIFPFDAKTDSDAVLNLGIEYYPIKSHIAPTEGISLPEKSLPSRGVCVIHNSAPIRSYRRKPVFLETDLVAIG